MDNNKIRDKRVPVVSFSKAVFPHMVKIKILGKYDERKIWSFEAKNNSTISLVGVISLRVIETKKTKPNRYIDSIRASFNDKRTERKEIPGNRDPDSCNICRSFRHLACKFNDSAHRRTRSAFLTGPSKRFPTCKSASRGAHQRFSRVPTSILELITTRAWADEPDSLARLRKNPDNSRLAHEHRIAYEKPESLWLNECVTPSLARSLLRGSFTCGWSRCFFFFSFFFFSLCIQTFCLCRVHARAPYVSRRQRTRETQLQEILPLHTR